MSMHRLTEKATNTVEAVLVMPILCAVAALTLDASRALYVHQTLSSVAQEGVRFASTMSRLERGEYRDISTTGSCSPPGCAAGHRLLHNRIRTLVARLESSAMRGTAISLVTSRITADDTSVPARNRATVSVTLEASVPRLSFFVSRQAMAVSYAVRGAYLRREP